MIILKHRTVRIHIFSTFCIIIILFFVSQISLSAGQPPNNIAIWIDLYEANLQNLKTDCKMKYLQISTTPDTILSLDILDQSDEEVQKMVEELTSGIFKVDDQKVYGAAEVFYKQDKFKLIERNFSKETPQHFSVIVDDNTNSVWRYDERPKEKGMYRMLQIGADLDRALFCAITPDYFLEDTMLATGKDKFIHIKYKDLMMLAKEESFKENDKSISFTTNNFRISADGQVQVDNSSGLYVAYEIDKSSGVILKNIWYNNEKFSDRLIVTDTKNIGSSTIPIRMYNEMYNHDGSIFTRNLFLVYEASTEPISDNEFIKNLIVPAGVKMVDHNLKLGGLTYEP